MCARKDALLRVCAFIIARRYTYRRSQVVVPGDPVLANARGFWDYVQDGSAERDAAAPVVSVTSTEPTPEPTPEPTLEPTLEPMPEPVAVPVEPVGGTTDRGNDLPGNAGRGVGRARRSRGG